MIERALSTYMRCALRREMKMVWSPERYAPAGGSAGPSLVYVHIPFCETLCPYCSFHRVRFEFCLAQDYFKALRHEVELYAGLGFRFEAVYVGGGTPTVLPGELASLLALMRNLWPIKHVSVETHPHHLTPSTIAILKEAGVDRLSVGIQTFNDALLAKLARLDHLGSGRDAQASLERVRGQFSTVNVDMIFNFPEQSPDMVVDDVRTIVELGMDQVTFYPLMEGSSSFEKVFGSLSARREKEYFRTIENVLLDAGYRPVTAWCFARGKGTADEYIVDHDEYAGLGSGAFGYCNGVLYANTFDVGAYVAALGRSELPIAAIRKFGLIAKIRYDLLMQLFGGALDLARMRQKYGRSLWLGLSLELLLLRLSRSVVRRGGQFIPTSRGRYYLVVMMREFFTGINRLREFMGAPRD